MNRRIFILVTVYLGIIVLFAYLRPKEIDWTPTFSTTQAIPFAARILYLELPEIRSEKIQASLRPVYNTVKTLAQDTSAIYFFLNNSFDPGKLDLRTLLEFVDKGNDVFIASSAFPFQLLDTLGIATRYQYKPSVNTFEWFYEDNISLTLAADTTQWPAASRSGYIWFYPKDSLCVDTLGMIDAVHPNFIRCTFGAGHVYLHSFPDMLTNYNMLYKDNHQYIARVLDQIPKAGIWIWDQYYNDPNRGRAQTPLAAFTRYVSFRWAYWLAVAGMAVFVFFTAKRRQRVIPVLQPKRNTTLDFVRTIGDLYYHHGDHRDLLQKKITMLRAYLFKKYRVTILEFSQEEASEIAFRSSLELSTVELLFGLARKLLQARVVSTGSVWEFQEALDRVYERPG